MPTESAYKFQHFPGAVPFKPHQEPLQWAPFQMREQMLPGKVQSLSSQLLLGYVATPYLCHPEPGLRLQISHPAPWPLPV